MPPATSDTKLECPFKEKDEAKALGAQWNNELRHWYVPLGVELDHFQRWLPCGRHYLSVPFEDKDDARALGAMWDQEKRRWYARAGSDLSVFAKWNQPAPTPSTPPRRQAVPQQGAGSSSTTPSTSAQKRQREPDVAAHVCPIHRVRLAGPRVVRNGQPHNIGREFFVCPMKDESCGLRGGWMWADGTAPFSAASCRRVEQHHGVEEGTVGVGLITGGRVLAVGNELRDGQLVKDERSPTRERSDGSSPERAIQL